jgi:DNA invertase Pin-like site-specific DNA recombinase
LRTKSHYFSSDWGNKKSRGTFRFYKKVLAQQQELCQTDFTMKMLVSYYRVSTKKQGLDGYGMGSQKEIVSRYVSSQNGNLIAEFAEVETGKNDDRPELEKALALVKKQKATLVIAKLDRLSRNAAFLLTLQNAGCDFVCCDCPNADKFTIGILALVAQRERELISERTKYGMAVAKERGAKIGTQNPEASVRAMVAGARGAKTAFAAKMASVVAEIRSSGVETLQGVADCLNRRGYPTRTGKQWFPASVRNLIAAFPA